MMIYTFTKSPVSLDRLTAEIRASAITTALDYCQLDGTSTLSVVFKMALTTEDEGYLNAIVAAHTGQPLIENEVKPVSISGLTLNAAEKAIPVAPVTPEGSDTLLVSHDFCDKTTWWSDSQRVTTEALTTSDDLTFGSDHEHWIDLTHGKVPYENRYASTYQPHIFVDGSEVTTGFAIDYDAGTVTFTQAQTGKTVTATYSYARSSAWSVKAAAGKVLKVGGTMLKMSGVAQGDLEVTFQVYAGGYPYGAPTIYKGTRDLVVCATDGQIMPASAISGQAHDIVVLDFKYIRGKVLRYSYGAEIRMSVKDDMEVEGDFAFVTAECVSIDEV